jgi:GMP synthase (glutamine-hydrolysing) B subunit
MIVDNSEKFVQNFCKNFQKQKCKKGIVLVSGGIDSTVSAFLLKKTSIKCYAILIDTGYLRYNEVNEVKLAFKKIGILITILNKQKEFYKALKYKTSPKEKRAAFRKKYFEIISNYVKKNKIDFIVQGTQFWKNSSKTYHNCPTKSFENLKIKLVEPVKSLPKDNIRKLAKHFDFPESITNRHPFPGPGLLIRFGGTHDLKKIRKIREATFIVDNFVETHRKNFKNCYQIFPYLCDASLVTYINQEKKGSLGNMILIRAISQKIKTNNIKYVPFNIMPELEKNLVSKLMEINGIGRIAFDKTPKNGSGSKINPGATIEYI